MDSAPKTAGHRDTERWSGVRGSSGVASMVPQVRLLSACCALNYLLGMCSPVFALSVILLANRICLVSFRFCVCPSNTMPESCFIPLADKVCQSAWIFYKARSKWCTQIK